jgi:hypothetical protein
MGEIVDLPVELILAILRQLRDEDYNLHLKRLSLVNKFFRDITNLRLWRFLRLTDEGIAGSKRPIDSTRRRWLQKYKDVAAVVTQDPHRAGCVHTLNIDIGESQLQWAVCLGTVVRNLEAILARLPALRSLRFSVSTTPHWRTQVAVRTLHIAVPAIASMLSKATFPFKLTHFECPMPILRRMAPFLHKQDAIERLVTIPHGHDQTARSLALARVRYLYVPTFPRLQHCEGSPLFVRAMARGRALRSVILDCRNVQEEWILRHRNEAVPPTYVDFLGVKGLIPGSLGSLSLLINFCGISLTSIKHLALRDYGSPPELLNFKMFRDFPQLQSLEYELRFSSILTQPFITQFERYCPTVRRVTLIYYAPNERIIEFIRKDSLNFKIIDETWETAMWGDMVGILPLHADILGRHGPSSWMVRTSVEVLAEEEARRMQQ